jgi:segregation and condensation protein A
MQDYKVELDVFEGPLDLLLHLIRTQEIDICDIPIARITDQYLQYLQMMRDLSITVAGEFLVMASTLIYIKSRMLLPATPAALGEEIEDPREDLVQQLLEHERFKNAAQLLYQRETVELSVWGRGEGEFDEEEKEMVAVGIFDLVQAFHTIVERYKDQIVLEVQRENVTLEGRLEEIRRLLKVKKEIWFSTFFEQKLSRLFLVVTVLALLELVKRQEVRLFQKGMFEDILIAAC